MSGRRLEGLLTRGTLVLPHERRAVTLAFACNFLVLASYYILRPVRDTVATVFGTDQLQLLFTATLLALVPYALLRGPFNRLARLFLPAAPVPPVEPTHNNTFIH